MIPVVASLVVGTFTGVKYIVSLTETINKNQAAITIINEKDLKNQIDYISQLTNNQNNLLLRVEREKGNNDIIQDKIKIIDEKIRELESDFKSLLIKRSN
jgi:phosphopantothenate synthetase